MPPEDEFDLSKIFPDNPAYQQYQRNLIYRPTVTDAQIAEARAKEQAAMAQLQNPPETSLIKVLAASLGAALPAIVGGATGGIEGAGHGGQGATNAMLSAQRGWEEDKEREASRSNLAFTLANREATRLADTAAEEKRAHEGNVRQLWLAGGNAIEERRQRLEDRAFQERLQSERLASDRSLKEMELEAKRGGGIGQAKADEILQQFGVTVGADWSMEDAKRAIDAQQDQDKIGREKYETLAKPLEAQKLEETKQGGKEKLQGLKVEGQKEVLKFKKELRQYSPEFRRVVALVAAGEKPSADDILAITDGDEMDEFRKWSQGDRKLDQGDRKLDQGDRKLDQGDRSLGIREKSVDATIAQQQQNAQIRREQLAATTAGRKWDQAFKVSQATRQAAQADQRIEIQRQRNVIAANNAKFARPRALGESAPSEEAKAQAKAAIAGIYPDARLDAIVDLAESGKDLKDVIGEARRLADYRARLTGASAKNLSPSAMASVEKSMAISSKLKPVYRALTKLEQLNKNHGPLARYTLQQMLSRLPLQEKAILQQELEFGAINMLYNLSGKAVTDSERDTFKDFFAGKTALSTNWLKTRFNEIARTAHTEMLADLTNEASIPGRQKAAAEVGRLALKEMQKSHRRDMLNLNNAPFQVELAENGEWIEHPLK